MVGSTIFAYLKALVINMLSRTLLRVKIINNTFE